MHRLSLGSPSTKLHGSAKEETLINDDEPKRRDDDNNNNNNNKKAPKSQGVSLSDKFIHLIPLLTLLCFFILFLCSHTPSSSDLAQFGGGFKHLDSAAEIKEIGKYAEAKRGDVLAIRSLRSLQEIGKSRPHRKIADF